MGYGTNNSPIYVEIKDNVGGIQLCSHNMIFIACIFHTYMIYKIAI